MRSDLLYAQASLDWAISNLPSLEERLNLWCKDNIKTVLEKADSDATHDAIIVVEKSDFPISFSVEAGAYINVIRSSLDILAWAIHERCPVCGPRDVYFPVANSEADWRSGNYKGAKFIAGLNGPERSIFESLNPYKEGYGLLYALHHLDITRKHSRLLKVAHVPAKLTLIGDFKMDEFVPVKNERGRIPVSGNRETILGLWAKSAAKPKINYTPEIEVSEPGLGIEGPIMPLLGELTRHAQAIIKLFDYA